MNGIEVRPLAARHHRHAIVRPETFKQREGTRDQDIATDQQVVVQVVSGGAKLVDFLPRGASLLGQVPGPTPFDKQQLPVLRDGEFDPYPRKHVPGGLEKEPLGINENAVVVPQNGGHLRNNEYPLRNTGWRRTRPLVTTPEKEFTTEGAQATEKKA
jgi:hypothetical protein